MLVFCLWVSCTVGHNVYVMLHCLGSETLESGLFTEMGAVSMVTAAPLTTTTPTGAVDLLDAAGHDEGAPLVDGSYQFDGSTALQVLTFPTVTGTRFALAMLFRAAPGSSGYLIAKSTVSGSRYYSLYFTSTTEQVYFFYRVTGETTIRFLRFTARINDGVEHSLILSVDGTACSLFVDDTLVGQQQLHAAVDDCVEPESTSVRTYACGVERSGNNIDMSDEIFKEFTQGLCSSLCTHHLTHM